MKLSERGKRAIQEFHKAAWYESADPASLTSSEKALCERNATQARLEAESLLGPVELVRGAGEVVRRNMSDTEKPWIIVDTLEHPNSITVVAAEHRMLAADSADVLALAVDAAVSAGATNSLEKMLCHQMAAAHRAAMQLLFRFHNNELQPVDRARLANASARMMQVYQEGILTLQKLRTGGKQTVVVQHVQVSGGGQAVAVIARNVKTGAVDGRKGVGAEMDNRPHEKRHGWLKNGNRPGDLSKAPRCGAKTRCGTRCKCPAMPNGRCRLHGGLSTGPKTAEGIERIRQAVTKHGVYSKTAKAQQQYFRQLLREFRAMLEAAR